MDNDRGQVKPAAFPGTPQHQALLQSIVALYQDDPRIRAVIVFGSLGRGDWDRCSDLDLDVIVADEVQIDLPGELERLCGSFAWLGERAAIILPYGDDEADIVLASLAQLSIRYHPLSQTSPAIVESMQVLAGGLERAEIAAAAQANHPAEAQPLTWLLDSLVRYAVVADVELQRGHFWSADEILHRMRALLMEIYARAHGAPRAYHFFDRHADGRLQQALGAALPGFDHASLHSAFIRTLDLLEGGLGDLSAGQLALTPAQAALLARLRRPVDSEPGGAR